MVASTSPVIVLVRPGEGGTWMEGLPAEVSLRRGESLALAPRRRDDDGPERFHLVMGHSPNYALGQIEADLFDWDPPARYDAGQLRFWQKEAVAAASDETLLAWFRQSAEGRALPSSWNDERLAAMLAVVRDNIEMPKDVAEWLQRLSGKQVKLAERERRVLLHAGRDFFQAGLSLLDTPHENFRDFAKAVGKATGAKGKDLFMPLRVALTGVTHGPEMARVWDWLGRDICRARLQAALDSFDGAEIHAETV